MASLKHVIFLTGLVSLAAMASSGGSIDSQLDSLRIPANEMPRSVSKEKVYAIHDRYTKLGGVHEFTLGGAHNFTPGDFIYSNQLDVGYYFHLNNSFALKLGGSWVTNNLNSSGARLLETQKRLPDSAFAKYRGELLLVWNAVYGKFRLSQERNLYFDIYAALGPGLAMMNTGSEIGVVADVGFVFWLSKSWSARAGVKDSFHNEKQRLSEAWEHNVLAHVDIGYMLGTE